MRDDADALERRDRRGIAIAARSKPHVELIHSLTERFGESLFEDQAIQVRIDRRRGKA
jgi:hypothetical protein